MISTSEIKISVVIDLAKGEQADAGGACRVSWLGLRKVTLHGFEHSELDQEDDDDRVDQGDGDVLGQVAPGITL